MQTEMMLRLLSKDPVSKSGYRIAGYMKIVPGGVYISKWDAFELGIKSDKGTLWFEGDRGRTIGGLEFTLMYVDGAFRCHFDEDWEPSTTILCLDSSTRIGNIHEEG